MCCSSPVWEPSLRWQALKEHSPPPTPPFFSDLQSVLFAFFKPHLDLRMLDLRR